MSRDLSDRGIQERPRAGQDQHTSQCRQVDVTARSVSRTVGLLPHAVRHGQHGHESGYTVDVELDSG